MDNTMLSVLRHLIAEYGDDMLSSMLRTNAVLLDLAPSMTRERILVRSFIEINGYNAYKNAGDEYPMIKRKLMQTLITVYRLDQVAAEWVTRLFGVVLGYESANRLNIPDAFDNSNDNSNYYSNNNNSDYNNDYSNDTSIDNSLSDKMHFNMAMSYENTYESTVPVDMNAYVAIGKAHTVAVATDGTVFSHGANEYFQCDVSSWRNVVAVAAGDAHTLGLRADGTVLATGRSQYDQCDVGQLVNVASIYAFGNDTFCVKTDGTVVAIGASSPEVSHFTGIKSIARFPEGVFGIREDGTVAVAYNADTDPEAEDSEEAQWARSLTGVKQIISTYIKGSVVLKDDGHIYKMDCADNYFAPWRDIVSIVDLSDCFALLRSDGTVRILSYDRDQPRKATDADNWWDITAIYGKYKRLMGLTIDGTLRAVCTDNDWLRRNGSLRYVADWYPVGCMPGLISGGSPLYYG